MKLKSGLTKKEDLVTSSSDIHRESQRVDDPFVQFFLSLSERVQLEQITLDSAKQEVRKQQERLGLTQAKACDARLTKGVGSPDDLAKLNQLGQAFARLDMRADDLAKTSPQHAYVLTALYLEAAQIIGEEQLVALCHFTQAMNLMALGRHYEAIDMFKKASPVAKRRGSPDFYAQVEGNLGNAYQEMSNLQQALIHYKTARDICQRRANWGQQGKWTANMGICCFKLNQWDQAQELYEEALELYIRASDHEGLRITYELLAQLKLATARQDEALQYLGDALQIDFDPGNRHDQAYSYLLQAVKEAVTTGNIQTVIELVQRALRIARSLQNRVIEALCYLRLGMVDESLEEYDLAAEQYDISRRLAQEIGDSMLCYVLNASLGNLHATYLNKPRQAFRNYQAAIEALEQTRSSAGLEFFAIDFMADKIDVHDRIIKLCLGHEMDYDLDGESVSGAQVALHFIERARSRALVDALAVTPLAVMEPVDSSVLAREAELLDELRQIRQRSYTIETISWQSTDFHSEIETMRQQTEIQRQLDAVYDELVSPAPQYVALRRSIPLSYQEIHLSLDKV